MRKYYFLTIQLFFVLNGFSQIKILFDATKAESATNADWVIDSDLQNLDWYPGPLVSANYDESNPQRYPTLAQSNITASTAETYWQGGLSNWAIDCVKKGYVVETLPYNGSITYGNSANPQDLSNYKVFIIDEPNILFTASEKTAMMNFVMNGGGLFMISDHTISDRNNDGDDSPVIWNDFLTNNGVANNASGITFDLVDISQTSSTISALATDSIIHGPAGNVTQVKWSNGTTMTINPAQNSSVKAVVFKSGTTPGNSNVLCAYARLGQGKIAAIGDSSPTDDGTGDPNDVLYNGYTGDVNGNHQKLIMNITIWLATINAQAPVASFTSSTNSVCVGSTVNYTSTSTGNPSSYSWSFPGGTPSTSTQANPTVTYNTAGTYNVSLTATNAAGSNSSSQTNAITVNALPTVAAITGGSSLCAGNTLQMACSTSGGVWSLTSLQNASISSNGLVSAANAGTISVVYTVTNLAGCTKTVTKALTIHVLPSVTLGALSSVCQNGPNVVLTGGLPSGGTYSGANVSSNQFAPITAGTTPITYSYTDNNNCTATAQSNITVHALPIVTLSNFSDRCISDGPLTLNQGTPTGGIYAGTYVSNGIFNPTTAGNYTISYSYTDNNNCSATAQNTVQVNDCAGLNTVTASIVSVYPNPFADQLNVSSPQEIELLNIYDLNGKKLVEIKPYSKDYTVEIPFSNNIFLLEIMTAEGSFKKLVYKLQ